MHRKKVLVNVGVADNSRFSPQCEDLRIARPMSYYVNGGVDLDGVSDRPPLPGEFDSPEDVASGELNAATDPRVGRLDLVDLASHMASDSAKRSANDLADVD